MPADVYILGASGFAIDCYYSILTFNKVAFNVLGFIADEAFDRNTELPLPFFPSREISDLEKPITGLLCTANIEARKRFLNELIPQLGINLATAIHPLARFSPYSNTPTSGPQGVFTEIDAHVASGTLLGEGVFLARGSAIGHETTIGRGSVIGAKTEIAGKVSIGDFCDIGPMCFVGAGMMIGNNVKVLPGSCVLRSVEANCVVGGNPAVVLKRK